VTTHDPLDSTQPVRRPDPSDIAMGDDIPDDMTEFPDDLTEFPDDLTEFAEVTPSPSARSYIPDTLHDDRRRRQARFNQAFLGSEFSMDTRYTHPRNVGRGQEIVFDDMEAPVGVRNVRAIPRQALPEENVVPGGFVNPNVSNWYYQNSFKVKCKRSWASENMPWLFGPEGVYPEIYECPDECEEDPTCICPDDASRRRY
jgi:hypothetical protein